MASCLWYKLQRVGIKGKIMNALQSLYDGVECCVRVNGAMTGWFSVDNGLKQGCGISPTLFAIYVNDLAQEINSLKNGIQIGEENISILLFADDIALISDSEEKVQAMLTQLHKWCRKWRLNLNMDKTKIVHYRSEKDNRSNFNFKFGEKQVEYVNSYKYLGLWFEEHLNLIEMTKPLASSAHRALGSLIAKFHAIGGMSHNVFSHLYDSLVHPVLNYGASIWGTTSFSHINSVQNKACRFFLGVGSKASNCAMRGDMGWVPQPHRQYIGMSHLFHRAENIEDERLIGKVHKFVAMKGNRGLWCNKVKKIFKHIEFDSYNDTSASSKTYVSEFKKQLKIHDQVTWYYELFDDKDNLNGNKLRTYRLHKDRNTTEPYVSCSMNRYERSILSRLRTGSLPLEIETGRYKKVPLDERICKLCQESIEDEIHFIVDCQFYNDLRYSMFALLNEEFTDFDTRPSIVKYILIMQSTHVKQISSMIVRMYNRRKSYMP